MNSVQVEYIGLKAEKTDNVAGTGTVWHGPGDVQPVPLAAWVKMVPFSNVWRLAEEIDIKRSLVSATPAQPAIAAAPAPAPAPAAPTAPAPRVEMLYGTNHPALIDIDGQQVQLGTLVAAAHTASELSIADWNDLPDADRHDFVEAEIEARRIAASDAKVKAAAEALASATKPPPVEQTATGKPARKNGKRKAAGEAEA